MLVVPRIVMSLAAVIVSLISGYFSVTYAMSAIGIADETFASSLAGEFTVLAVAWAIVAVFFAALARKSF